MRLSVAIDGPAGAGKSTIAKIIGKNFNLMYINTGAMYRAVTVLAIRDNISYSDIEKLCTLVDSLEIHFYKDRIIVNNQDLSDKINMPEISNKVSNYAAVPEIRERLVTLQRRMSEKYDVVMDGRDIGTVVFPEAEMKVFVTAKAEIRAQRRFDELQSKGDTKTTYEEVLENLRTRDHMDQTRAESPLIQADDAILLDNSYMTIDDQMQWLVQKFKQITTN